MSAPKRASHQAWLSVHTQRILANIIIIITIITAASSIVQPAPFLWHPECKLAQVARQPSGALWDPLGTVCRAGRRRRGLYHSNPPTPSPVLMAAPLPQALIEPGEG